MACGASRRSTCGGIISRQRLICAGVLYAPSMLLVCMAWYKVAAEHDRPRIRNKVLLAFVFFTDPFVTVQYVCVCVCVYYTCAVKVQRNSANSTVSCFGVFVFVIILMRAHRVAQGSRHHLWVGAGGARPREQAEGVGARYEFSRHELHCTVRAQTLLFEAQAVFSKWQPFHFLPTPAHARRRLPSTHFFNVSDLVWMLCSLLLAGCGICFRASTTTWLPLSFDQR